MPCKCRRTRRPVRWCGQACPSRRPLTHPFFRLCRTRPHQWPTSAALFPGRGRRDDRHGHAVAAGGHRATGRAGCPGVAAEAADARSTPYAGRAGDALRFPDAKPINFGRGASPRHLAVHGVDVSRWQGNVNWGKLRAQGANFAYIKATDGGDHLDPMFRTNWRNADAAGLKRGAYHFFYWCRTAGEQADWFIRNVPRVEGALPPVIDVEWNGESSCKRRPSRATVQEKMQVFMDKLERHYGQRPIIYTSPDFYRDNLRGAFLDYPFWLRAVARHPSKVYPGRKWLFWQYSGSGLSHGVRGRIDLNVFHGDERQWRAWAGGSRQMVADAD
ncbi:muramidase [Mesorhizobium amorphae CCBAU 01583]|nr:muramidase [Mesorhizobium amorphae CCBAU 01583]